MKSGGRSVYRVVSAPLGAAVFLLGALCGYAVAEPNGIVAIALVISLLAFLAGREVAHARRDAADLDGRLRDDP